MTGWRLIQSAYANDALSGYGSSLSNANRWNSKGTPAVYISEHLSLAALELLTKMAGRDFQRSFTAVEIEIPDSMLIEHRRIEDLPHSWRDKIKTATQTIGNEWLQKKTAAVLKIPSAVTPQEFNFLLNPSHQDFSQIKISRSIPFSFDSRLWK